LSLRSILASFERRDALALVIGLAGAVMLYRFGLSYPLEFRVRGDAAEYMEIAKRFGGLTDALSYVGDRTLGMPLVDYLFRAPSSSSEGWARSVTAFLFAVHLGTTGAAVWLVRSRGWLTKPFAVRALFVFLATFPGLVGHTTVPLTDTLAIDLVLLALIALTLAGDTASPRGVMFGVLSGLVSAFAVLIRPSYAIPALASAGFLVVVLWAKRRRGALTHPGTVSAVVLVAILAVVGQRCATVYGPSCLQNPRTFEPIRHAQMGLRGARILWYGPYPTNGEFPVLPDSVLAPCFYGECKLTRLAGTDDTSLSGCFMHRLYLVPIYAVKKWIGLFDHFRFQPYVEQRTPDWLRKLSRTYDATAFVGLFFALGAAIAAARRPRHAASLVDPLVLAQAVFLLVLLAEHTVLHVEDRFSLPFVPVCALFVARLLERAADLWRAKQKRDLVLLAGAVIVAIGAFFAQVLTWDDQASASSRVISSSVVTSSPTISFID
jgi:hypothetical protein